MTDEQTDLETIVPCPSLFTRAMRGFKEKVFKFRLRRHDSVAVTENGKLISIYILAAKIHELRYLKSCIYHILNILKHRYRNILNLIIYTDKHFAHV